jgi:hypothetical protein
MENITTAVELKLAIRLLEEEQALKGELLKKQFFITYESLKPVSLLKSTLKDVASSPWLIENIIGTTLGITTGYFSKKLVVGASGNIVRKLLGSVLQFGITNIIAQNRESISSFGQSVFKRIFRKDRNKSPQVEDVNESKEQW